MCPSGWSFESTAGSGDSVYFPTQNLRRAAFVTCFVPLVISFRPSLISSFISVSPLHKNQLKHIESIIRLYHKSPAGDPSVRTYGGLCEARTHDIMVVTHALSQLS